MFFSRNAPAAAARPEPIAMVGSVREVVLVFGGAGRLTGAEGEALAAVAALVGAGPSESAVAAAVERIFGPYVQCAATCGAEISTEMRVTGRASPVRLRVIPARETVTVIARIGADGAGNGRDG